MLIVYPFAGGLSPSFFFCVVGNDPFAHGLGTHKVDPLLTAPLIFAKVSSSELYIVPKKTQLPQMLPQFFPFDLFSQLI